MTDQAEFPSGGDPLLGELIGDRYRILSVLGDGGMGTVYLAEHVLMEKRVALKVLHPTLAVVSSVMDRFQKEAIALARIEHPNVVSASDFGKLRNGSFYLALEYIDGINLGELLAREGAIAVPRAVSIGLQIAQALAAAHSQNIVHRDLKPHNVMLLQQPAGEMIKVLDFGLAKLRSRLGDGSISLSAGKIFGTPHYMSPEQISGTPVDGRSDLYSLGVMLYEMVAGRRPFESEEIRQVLALQLASTAAPLPDHVPAALQTLIQRLLAKSPDQRPPNAEQVLAQLEEIQNPPEPPAPPRPWWRQTLEVRGRAVPAWALGLPLVVFIAIFVIGTLASERQRQPAPALDVPPPATAAVAPEPARSPTTLPSGERWPVLISEAEFGNEEALSQLLSLPEKERSVEVWRALAQGRILQQRASDALDLYRLAIQHNPALKEDEDIAKFVRLACADPKLAQQAVTFAAESLGARGVDVLFSVWSETKRRTPETALAGRYLKQDQVLSKGSKAVRLALELRGELSCQQQRQLVERAKRYGDSRSTRPLLKLRKKACLAADPLLTEAISAAGQRKAPRF